MIVCLIISGCEVYTHTSPHPHSNTVVTSHDGITGEVVYEVYEVDVVYDAYCPYSPYEYGILPYYSTPWACYSMYGVEYCEWVFSDYYGECIETWYWDEEYCDWYVYDEVCYYW